MQTVSNFPPTGALRSTEAIERTIVALGTLPTPQREQAFHDAVCRFADDSRSAGVLPEHVIIMLRDAMRRTGQHLPDRLTRRMVEWAMLQYFARDE